jgi:hypothetical protein
MIYMTTPAPLREHGSPGHGTIAGLIRGSSGELRPK